MMRAQGGGATMHVSVLATTNAKEQAVRLSEHSSKSASTNIQEPLGVHRVGVASYM